MKGVRPYRVFQVAEIADDVNVGAKFPRLAALGWLSCTYQAGEVEDAANIVERRDLNVRSWHETDVQRLPGLGLLTGALPTFGGTVSIHP